MVWLITFFTVIGQLWLIYYHIKVTRKLIKVNEALRSDYSELLKNYFKLLAEIEEKLT